jgi:hypothetical protein
LATFVSASATTKYAVAPAGDHRRAAVVLVAIHRRPFDGQESPDLRRDRGENLPRG